MQYNLSEVFKYLKLDWSNEDDLQFFEDEFNQTHTKDTDSILEDMLVNRIRCSSNGVLTITIEVPRLLCSRQILYLEKKFEKHFSVPQVIIRQKANFEVTAQDKKLFLEGIDPWIIKHAKMSSTMEGRLFAQGKVHVDNENLIWKLDENHFDLANNKDRNWLEDFWDKYGCLSCDIRLEACQDECSDKLIEQTEQLVAEANSLASELYQNKLTDFKNNTARSSVKKAKSKQNKYRRKHRKSKDILWGRTGPEIPLVKISEINNETDRALIEGEVFLFQTKITRNGRLLVKFAITDLSTSISCTIFTDPEEKEYLSKIIENQYIKVTANVVYDDRYAKDFVGRVTCIEKATKPASRQDNYPDKRVELHIHSKLSAKDGTINPKDIVKTAADFGHPAVAITDHGVVQAFPEVCQMADELASKGKAIKIIYGLEGYLLDDGFDYFAYQVENIPLISDFIIFNLSCTGDNPKRDQIWKISALKYSYTDLAPEDFNNSLTNSQKDKAENKENQLKSACLSKDNYKVIDEFQAFINIKNEVDNDILQEIEKQAGSIENIQEAKSIKEVLLDFSKFCQELPMIALDAVNQLNFLRYGGFDVEGTGARTKFNPPLIDLSGFAKAMSNGDKTRLKLSTDNLNFLANEYIELLIKADVPDLVSLNHLSDWKSFSQLKKERKKTNHIILLAEDLLGLYNLYRLCSASHLDYFYYSPRIPRSLLSYYGAGIIKGMACIDGEIFSEILTLYNQCKGDFDQAKAELSNSKLVKLAQFYNFLEIQPLTNNAFLLRE
ncbi:MAG TPA: PHP domain-containing protein, partial [Candidatus Eisenbacteria bacterium]|nr:PHP domain-containing protein [Candidatus Eisenbacteria bacterium]